MKARIRIISFVIAAITISSLMHITTIAASKMLQRHLSNLHIYVDLPSDYRVITPSNIQYNLDYYEGSNMKIEEIRESFANTGLDLVAGSPDNTSEIFIRHYETSESFSLSSFSNEETRVYLSDFEDYCKEDENLIASSYSTFDNSNGIRFAYCKGTFNNGTGFFRYETHEGKNYIYIEGFDYSGKNTISVEKQVKRIANSVRLDASTETDTKKSDGAGDKEAGTESDDVEISTNDATYTKEEQYYIEELDVFVTAPPNYTLITPENAAEDSYFCLVHDVSREDIRQWFIDRKVSALVTESYYDVKVSYTEPTIDNAPQLLSDANIDQVLAMYKDSRSHSKDYELKAVDSYKSPQGVWFIRFEAGFSSGSLLYGYATYYNGYEIMISGIIEGVSDKQMLAILTKQMADSLVLGTRLFEKLDVPLAKIGDEYYIEDLKMYIPEVESFFVVNGDEGIQDQSIINIMKQQKDLNLAHMAEGNIPFLAAAYVPEDKTLKLLFVQNRGKASVTSSLSDFSDEQIQQEINNGNVPIIENKDLDVIIDSVSYYNNPKGIKFIVGEYTVSNEIDGYKKAYEYLTYFSDGQAISITEEHHASSPDKIGDFIIKDVVDRIRFDDDVMPKTNSQIATAAKESGDMSAIFIAALSVVAVVRMSIVVMSQMRKRQSSRQNSGSEMQLSSATSGTTSNTKSDHSIVMTQNPQSNEFANVNTDVQAMFCRKCGAKIPTDSEFCPKCGAKVIVMDNYDVKESVQ